MISLAVTIMHRLYLFWFPFQWTENGKMWRGLKWETHQHDRLFAQKALFHHKQMGADNLRADSFATPCVSAAVHFIPLQWPGGSCRHRTHIFWLTDTSNNLKHKLIFDKKKYIGVVVNTAMTKIVKGFLYTLPLKWPKEIKMYILERIQGCYLRKDSL